jgi:hypothetical protein
LPGYWLKTGDIHTERHDDGTRDFLEYQGRNARLSTHVQHSIPSTFSTRLRTDEHPPVLLFGQPPQLCEEGEQ